MQGATEADITARIEDAEELRTKAIELTRQTKYLQKLTSRTPVDAAARAAQLGDIEALAITYFVEATRRADETMAEFERRCIVVPRRRAAR
jgi:recombinational DNA repair protein RecT